MYFIVQLKRSTVTIFYSTIKTIITNLASNVINFNFQQSSLFLKLRDSFGNRGTIRTLIVYEIAR